MLQYAFQNNPDRRKFLQSLSAGVMGYGLADVLALEAAHKTAGQPERGA